MRIFRSLPAVLLLVAALLIWGCSSEDGITEPPEEEGNLPEVPVPDSVNDLLPASSESKDVGMSREIETFSPTVTRYRQMLDDGTYAWIDADRRLLLACADVLPVCSSDTLATDKSYVSVKPRLMHTRYWRKVKQVTLEPGTTSYQYEETITSGTSTSHTESREFSSTMGIEVSVGGSWGPFSASVTASYEQTETVGEVNTVSFSEETSVTETFTVQADPDRTTIYAIWQLVDRFTLVDADTVRVHESEILRHVELPEIAHIEFPSHDTIYQSTTFFD